MFNNPYNPYWGGSGFGPGPSGRGAGFWSDPYGGPGRGSRGRGRRGGRGPGFGPGPFFGPGSRGWLGAGGAGFAGAGFGPGAFPGAAPLGGRRGGAIRFALLALLKSDGPRNGAELIQALTERSLGRWFPNPALVYGTLQQLEDEGLVRASTSESGSGRSFELTEAGTEYLNQVTTQQQFPGAPLDDRFTGLRRTIIGTVAAARQAVASGDPELVAKATELLDQARQGLYRLLAGDADNS